jgi:SH3 domain-containing protein
MAHPSSGNTPTQPTPRGTPWGALIGIVVLSLIGFAMLAYAIFTLTGGTATPAPGGAEGATRAVVPTQIAVFIPTTTAVPPTLPPTPVPPTDTPAPTETGQGVSSTDEPVLNILQPANVRSGPGLNYPVIGGLAAGKTAAVVGRDASAKWYVISYSGALSGQGWVSALVSSYTGDTNSLPVIAAPPPPPPTNPPPPTDTPPSATTGTPAGPTVYNSHGIEGNSFSVESTVVVAGQDIWFNFKVTNTTGTPISYAVLAAHVDNGPNAKSWTDAILGGHQVLNWRDHINISTPGTYQLYLGICYGNKNACLANQTPWDRLSDSVTVTVR